MQIANFWAPNQHRELDTTPLKETAPARVVACLNIWNDLGALKATISSWFPYVDAIVAVDGSYDTLEPSLSTDGAREYLSSLKKPVTLIDAAGMSQCEKRTLYLKAGKPGDMLFIIDADETVTGGAGLRGLTMFDIGWVRVNSSLYRRQYGQPRLVRWQEGLHYWGRHHWIYQGDRLLATHQYGGPGFEHRPVAVTLMNQRGLNRDASRMHCKRVNLAEQSEVERIAVSMPTAEMSDTKIGARESLQIAMITYRDDGLAPSRLHSAINRSTPHASLFFKRRPGPFGVPDGFLSQQNNARQAQAMMSADVLHFHGVMSQARGSRVSTPAVFHHHGTMYRENHDEYNRAAKQRNALILLSNLELYSWTDGMKAYFLPNVMPVGRYRKLRAQHLNLWTGDKPFRIAHSPSKPERKGTNEFLAACARLSSRGIPIQPVLLHDLSHQEVLLQKATCHAAFDSFWLGMQCSGLEAAAMGMPVIAGDETVRERYVEEFGACPYTFAGNGEELEHQIERMVCDTAFRIIETERVVSYVTAFHDESAVALRYLDLLDVAFGWRTSKIGRNHVLTRVGAGR